MALGWEALPMYFRLSPPIRHSLSASHTLLRRIKGPLSSSAYTTPLYWTPGDCAWPALSLPLLPHIFRSNKAKHCTVEAFTLLCLWTRCSFCLEGLWPPSPRTPAAVLGELPFTLQNPTWMSPPPENPFRRLALSLPPALVSVLLLCTVITGFSKSLPVQTRASSSAGVWVSYSLCTHKTPEPSSELQSLHLGTG